jgi:hypothetical protein
MALSFYASKVLSTISLLNSNLGGETFEESYTFNWLHTLAKNDGTTRGGKESTDARPGSHWGTYAANSQCLLAFLSIRLAVRLE